MSDAVPKGCLAPMINRQGYYGSLSALSATDFEEAYNVDCNKQMAILFCTCQGIILAVRRLCPPFVPPTDREHPSSSSSSSCRG